MTDMRIPISKLTRAEWVRYRWIEVTQFGDSELMLLRSVERTPDEGAQAARDWDTSIEQYGELCVEEDYTK